jgi:alpha-L-rhamnosidase
VEPDSSRTLAFDGTFNDTQCSYALPLAYGIFADEYAAKAAARLDELTHGLGYALTTGFLGTGLISGALSRYGYSETAYKLLLRTEFPSWLYSVTQGATTIWERWNSFTVENGFGGNNSMNSFNHYSLGAIGAWLYAGVLGIRPDDAAPGYKHFIIAPLIGVLKYAKGHFDSPYGRIEVAWAKEGTRATLEVAVPANTTAELRLPGREPETLPSGRHTRVIE